MPVPVRDMDHPHQPPEDSAGRGKQAMSDLDDGFIRVLEDLIDALLRNGTLRLTDLPPPGPGKIGTPQGCPSAHARYAQPDQ